MNKIASPILTAQQYLFVVFLYILSGFMLILFYVVNMDVRGKTQQFMFR